ncbi:MAG: ATP-binding protein [Bacteroidales bacterium]|nr:ATP-binding protein [Bacteroidales bacterium]
MLRPELDAAFLEAHGILRRFQSVSFENIEAQGVPQPIIRQYDAVLDYASHLRQNIERGMGLIMLGTPGLLKTTLAVAVLRRLLETDIRGSGYMVPMVSLIDNLFTMRAMDKVEAAEYERRLRKCDLLILDDLGGEVTGQPWVMSKVDSIITERYNRMLPVIVTSNLDAKTMAGTYGGRIIDRLRSTGTVLRFNGLSLRKCV